MKQLLEEGVLYTPSSPLCRVRDIATSVLLKHIAVSSRTSLTPSPLVTISRLQMRIDHFPQTAITFTATAFRVGEVLALQMQTYMLFPPLMLTGYVTCAAGKRACPNITSNPAAMIVPIPAIASKLRLSSHNHQPNTAAKITDA